MSDGQHLTRKRDRIRKLLRPKSPVKPPSSDSATHLHAQVTDQNLKSSPARSPKAETDDTTLGKIQQRIYKNAIEQLPSGSQEKIQAQNLPSDKADIALTKVLEACQEKKRLCDSKRWTFEFNGKVIGLGEKVGNILEWVNRFKAAGDVVVNADPIHAGLPWGGIRILLEVAISERRRMACLVIGVEYALYMTKRLEAYTKYLCSVRHLEAADALENSVTQLYAAVLHFLLNARRTYQRSTLDWVIRSTWELQDVVDFDVKCDKLAHRVDSDAHACTRMENQDNFVSLAERLKNLQDIQTISDVSDSIWKALDRQRRTSILQWISDVPYEDNHKVASSGITKGTAEWIFKHSQFREWNSQTSSSILWLHGIPGAGKTKLTANVINGARQASEHKKSKQWALAYFYCNRNEDLRRSPVNILRAFIKQLSVSDNPQMIRRPVLEVFEAKEKAGFASKAMDYGEAELLLSELVARRETLLVLDALDECEEGSRRKFIKTIENLVQNASIKVFISSRRDDDIRSQLEKKANIGIEATDNQRDIFKYVSDVLSKDKRERSKPLSSQLCDEIMETLQTKSNGMFQWAFLQINHLLSFRLEADIRQNLNSLPAGLSEAYDRIYESIKGQKGSEGLVAIRAIQWIINSLEPLEPHVLVEAACQDPENDNLQPTDGVDINFILSVCRNLVVLVTRHSKIRGEFQVCELSHLSVREYFEQEQEAIFKEGTNLVATIHLSTLRRWPADMRYPNKAASVSDYDVFSNSRPSQNYNWLQSYIGRTWYRQIHQFGWIKTCEGTRILEDFLMRQGETSLAYRNWYEWAPKTFKLMDKRQPHLYGNVPLKVVLASSYNAAVAACALGFDNLLQEMLQSKAYTTDTRNSLGMSLLQISVWRGSIPTVQLLITYGADTNLQPPAQLVTRSNHYMHFVRHTPLMLASERGDAEMVNLLLANDADVDQKSCICEKYHGNALTAAVEAQSVELVKILLKAGAEVSPSQQIDGHGSTLAVAVGRRFTHIEIVPLLLDGGADVNMKLKGWCGSALAVAAVYNNLLAIQLLIENGAYINMKLRGRYGSALAAAAAYLNTEAMRLLIRNGADVNMKLEGKYGSALAAAATNRKGVPAVQLLLENGADVNAKLEGEYNSALAAAVAPDYFVDVDTIELLLKHGADDKCSEPHGSLVNSLAFKAPTPALQYLSADCAMDLDIKDSHGRTPLHLAAAGGNFSNVKYLTELGLDLTSLDFNGVKPVDILRARFGETELDDMGLLAATRGPKASQPASTISITEVPTSSEQMKCWTSLHWACRLGNTEVIDELIRDGFTSEIVATEQPSMQWTPLSIAIFHGRKGRLFEMLSEQSKQALGITKPPEDCDGYVVGKFTREFLSCKGCFQTIYGPFFRCNDHHQANYCFMCRGYVTAVHGTHSWEYVEDKSEFEASSELDFTTDSDWISE